MRPSNICYQSPWRLRETTVQKAHLRRGPSSKVVLSESFCHKASKSCNDATTWPSPPAGIGTTACAKRRVWLLRLGLRVVPSPVSYGRVKTVAWCTELAFTPAAGHFVLHLVPTMYSKHRRTQITALVTNQVVHEGIKIVQCINPLNLSSIRYHVASVVNINLLCLVVEVIFEIWQCQENLIRDNEVEWDLNHLAMELLTYTTIILQIDLYPIIGDLLFSSNKPLSSRRFPSPFLESKNRLASA